MQPSATPARRPPAERELRDWIYQKALDYRYFEDGVRTKEEKSIFIRELAAKLAERHGSDWNEKRASEQLRNLKKDRWKTAATPKAAPPPLALPESETRPPRPAQPEAAPAGQADGHREDSEADEEGPGGEPPLAALVRGWQVHMQAASRFQSEHLARHTSNRGACNEQLVREFLRATLGSAYVGVGTGELLAKRAGAAGAARARMPRQLDVLLWSRELPRLAPASSASDDAPACFLEESAVAVVEVKTTLTNQDLRDVGASAALLPPTLPVFVLAFESQHQLRTVDCSVLPANVAGVFAMTHGAVLLGPGVTPAYVYPAQRAPLVQLYLSLIDALERYAERTAHERLLIACHALRSAAAAAAAEGPLLFATLPPQPSGDEVPLLPEDDDDDDEGEQEWDPSELARRLSRMATKE